jgi:alkylation response protein AidB-like acyl-CoA dehydrogenase
VELALTAEQRDLGDTVRRLLDDTAPLPATRALLHSESGHDPAVWARLAELGLPALAVPEAHGGLGQGPVEVTVALEETGRVLYPGPLLAVVTAADVLVAAGDEGACARLLPGIAAGETIATVAGTWPAAEIRATEHEGSWVLSGRADAVVAGHLADVLLVVAGDRLFEVDPAHVRRTPQDGLDLTRRVARIDFDDTPGRPIGSAELGPAYDRLLLATAAEQTGGAAACLDLSVRYAKDRTQFGRPIGSFQAVAHTCVDMLAAVETARGCVRYAAAALADGSVEAPVAVRVAAARCATSFQQVTIETIEVHGGIGFTWEHDAHLYYRRAWSGRQLFGSPEQHWSAISDLLAL